MSRITSSSKNIKSYSTEKSTVSELVSKPFKTDNFGSSQEESAEHNCEDLNLPFKSALLNSSEISVDDCEDLTPYLKEVKLALIDWIT